MLLAIDIGNTNIVVGGFTGEELLFEYRLKTDTGKTIDEYAVLLLSLLQQRFSAGYQFSSCVICSVVPPMTPDIVQLVRSRFSLEPLVVGPGIRSGIKIRTPDPSSVGADRVVNALAARERYGAPAIVVDFGTATTFDIVSAEGNYEGGVIAPGAAVAMEALVRQTAKLPRIELSWPTQVVGKTTVTAMQSGTVLGYACLVDGLIERIADEVGEPKVVVATGGLGKLFAEHCARILQYDPHLTLHGMRLIAEANC